MRSEGNPPMKSKLISTMVLVLLATWLLPGCKLFTEEVSLPGTYWTLVSLNGHDLIPDSKITIIFGERETGVRLSGSAGCNGYFASIELADGQIHVPEIERELQLCIGQEGLMGQEKEYLETLSSIMTYEILDGRLELKNQAGEVVLVFHKDPKSIDPALLNKVWLLETLNGQPMIPDSRITAAFDEELFFRRLNVSGNAGCNAYAYVIELEQETLAFSTRIPDARGYGYAPFFECAGLIEQEEEYIATLHGVASYEVSDDRLELKNQAGEVVLVFRSGE
jgi:heat shock protein HslJ